MMMTMLGDLPGASQWDAAIASLNSKTTSAADKQAAADLIKRSQQVAAQAVTIAKATLAAAKKQSASSSNTAAVAQAQSQVVAAQAQQDLADAAAKAGGIAPFYTKGWFWALIGVGAVGTGTYLLWPESSRRRSGSRRRNPYQHRAIARRGSSRGTRR